MQGVKVCQAVFLYANTVTRYTLKKVLSHLEAGVIVTPDHGPGRKGQAAWNTLDEAETAGAVQFIQNYGDVYGLPQPAAPRGHNGPSPIYLPCFTTRKMVHGLDQQAEGAMSYRSFRGGSRISETGVRAQNPIHPQKNLNFLHEKK